MQRLHSQILLPSATIVLIAVRLLPAEGGADWPEFRGPGGDGRTARKDLPLSWSERDNVVWKTAIHGRGWSTPVVCDGQIWVTTATEDGRQLFALAVDFETGGILHDIKVFEVESPQPLGNPVNSYASPSPAVEPGRVYVHFGSYGTAAIETGAIDPAGSRLGGGNAARPGGSKGPGGRVLWQRRDLPCDHFRGPGSSPILFRDSLILTMDGFDVQYLIALEKTTGKSVWKTDRSFEFGDLDGDLRKAYSTPLVREIDGEPQMLTSSAKAAYSYDPRTGKELWRIRYDGFSNASRPVFGAGLVLLNTGFGKADLWAVRPEGRGDVTETHVVWRCTKGVPLKPSPIVVDDLVFMVNDDGVATCLEAATGKVIWQERLGGSFSASPIESGGRIYFSSEEGKTTVIDAGRSFRALARNELDVGFMASPAVAGHALILRTRTHLYRVEARRGTR